jgi:hypothetical protein
MGINPSEITFDILSSNFRWSDVNNIITETNSLLKTKPFGNLQLTTLEEETDDGECTCMGIDTVVDEGFNLDRTQLLCEPTPNGVLVLYNNVDKQSEDTCVLEVIMHAMAKIMPLSDVMSSNIYKYFLTL